MDAYSNEYYFYVVDIFDESVIVRMYSYLDGKTSLNRVKYTIDENGVVTLGDVNEVHIVYEDVPDSNIANHTILNGEGDEHVDPVTKEGNADATFNAEKVTNTTVVEDPAQVADPQLSDPAQNADPAQVSNAQVITDPQKGVEPDAITTSKEENSGSATLTDGERAEFEALKREKKETLINSYKDRISEDDFASFTARIDEIEFEDLEKELALIVVNNENANSTSVRIFSPVDTHQITGEKTTGALIKENLGR